jgi:hypothetical protein
MGISPLKNESGEEVIDSKGKAEILNQQYDSVFTNEDLNTISEQDTKVAQIIERLHITTNGVCMLLKKLDPTRSPFLKMAIMLACLQSCGTSPVRREWLNIYVRKGAT